LFSIGSFLITQLAQFLKLFLSTVHKIYVLILAKMGWATFRPIFANSSGHSVCFKQEQALAVQLSEA
jgi:hypothetical protein